MAIKGYWRLNGDANDASGNGNNLTVSNITYDQKYGRLKSGAYFNNTTARMYGNVPVNFNSDFTISIWFKTEPNTITWDWFLNFNNYGFSPQSAISLALLNKNLRWTYGPWFTEAITNYSTYPVLSNYLWYNAVFQRKGNQLYTFLNGVQYCPPVTTSVSNLPTTGILYFGRGPSKTLNEDVYCGSLDEIIIDNTAWSSARVKNEYARVKGFF